MSFWKKGIGATETARPVAVAQPAQDMTRSAGKYGLLYKYLRDRYANRVVLTFAEIEDLLGFALPDPARFQPEWWAGGGPITPRSTQSDAWTLAHRTAVVNLAARSVVFDRI